MERAHLEFLQGTVFVGHALSTHPELVGMAPAAVTGFDEHAVYYSADPGRWDEVPLLRHATPAAAPGPPDLPAPQDLPEPPVGAAPAGDVADQLRRLVADLGRAGVRLYYRELTTDDCNQLGLRVVRVLSPDLTPLHHDHRWPFLGGRTGAVTWRYPDADRRRGGRRFPSPHPHALG